MSTREDLRKTRVKTPAVSPSSLHLTVIANVLSPSFISARRKEHLWVPRKILQVELIIKNVKLLLLLGMCQATLH
jgi:hypothetical protein